MSIYRFSYEEQEGSGVRVEVVLDDSVPGSGPHIAHVIEAFSRFLLGVTFSPKTIESYLDTAAARDYLSTRACE